MSTSNDAVSCTATGRSNDAITGPLTFLFAVSVGVIVTNLFAPQTLVGLMGPSLGLDAAASGLLSMATQLGYAAGLFLLVPLADLGENRRLTIRMLNCAALAAAAAAAMPSAPGLLAMLFILGAASSAIQILVPIAASMAAPERRGRVIGDVMGGLMVGILLSRPLASAISDGFGWRACYVASAAAMVTVTLILAWRLPERRPEIRTNYPALLASLWHLLRDEPVLRHRALTASLAMAAFSTFWTVVALRLAQAPFDLDQRDIALFALVGAAGAVATPLAGRAGDRGWTRPATVVSDLIMIAAFALAAWAGAAPAAPLASLALLGLSAVLLDIGVSISQTLGRRAINLLQAQARGRINALFVGSSSSAAPSARFSPASPGRWAAGRWSACWARPSERRPSSSTSGRNRDVLLSCHDAREACCAYALIPGRNAAGAP